MTARLHEVPGGSSKGDIVLVMSAVFTATVLSTAAAVETRQRVFAAGIVAGRAHVAASIACFIALKVVELLRPAARQRTMIAVAWIVAVVDVAVKAAWSMEPRPCAEEDPSHKPVRPVVAVGRTIIGGIVEISVRADRRHTDLDGNLCRGLSRCGKPQQTGCQGRKDKML